MLDRLFVFGKAQVSSFIGGIVDYIFMISITEFFGVHYILSIVIGGLAGAVVNFSINRCWAFRSKEVPYQCSGRQQVLRFCLVVINSIMLKTTGTWFFTSFMKIDYKISRVITDLIVSIIFNYMLQRHWVFKKERT